MDFRIKNEMWVWNIEEALSKGCCIFEEFLGELEHSGRLWRSEKELNTSLTLNILNIEVVRKVDILIYVWKSITKYVWRFWK